MKKTIRIIAVLLVVGMLTFVAGQETARAADKPFAGTTLRVIAEAQNPTMALEKQLPKFEELTGIKVELEYGPMDSVVNKELLSLMPIQII